MKLMNKTPTITSLIMKEKNHTAPPAGEVFKTTFLPVDGVESDIAVSHGSGGVLPASVEPENGFAQSMSFCSTVFFSCKQQWNSF